MYENAKYVAVPAGSEPSVIFVYINGVPASVPIDPANTDYANMMQLVAEGQLVIQPADGAKK